MKRHYYVVASWSKADNTSGILGCEATSTERHLSMIAINSWVDNIKRINKFDNVIITNIIPIEKEEGVDEQ